MDKTPALIMPVELRYESKTTIEPLALPLSLETIERIEARRAEFLRLKREMPDVREIQVDIDVEMCNLAVEKDAWKKKLGKDVRTICRSGRNEPFLAGIETFRELPWRFHEAAWLRLREDGFTVAVKANASPNFPPMVGPALSYGYLTIAAIEQTKGERDTLFTELARRSPEQAAALLKGEIRGTSIRPNDLLSSLRPESLAPLLEAEEAAIRELALASLPATRRSAPTR